MVKSPLCGKVSQDMVNVGMAIANVPQDMVKVYVDMVQFSLGMVNVS
jgi:hypothetical protein